MAENNQNENPMIEEDDQIKRILDEIKQSIDTNTEQVDLAYFFALAYESGGVDRGRFPNAIKYLLNKHLQTEPLVSRSAINQGVASGQSPGGGGTISVSSNQALGAGAGSRSGSGDPLSHISQFCSNTQSGQQTNLTKTYIVCFDPKFETDTIEMMIRNLNSVENIRVRSTRSSTNPYHYTLTCLVSDIYCATYEVYFLRYKLRSSEVRDIFTSRSDNQIYIQGILPGRPKITIQKYLDDDACKYKPRTFYHKLEELALVQKVKDVYIASALSSNDSMWVKNVDGNTYTYLLKKPNGKYYTSQFLANRHFESSCELLVLFHKISSRGKKVYYINLDSYFRAFDHPSIQGRPSVPFIVPFDSETTFFINQPKRFLKTPPTTEWTRGWAARGDISIPVLEGGRRKPTRKSKSKRKAQTKRRKPKA